MPSNPDTPRIDLEGMTMAECQAADRDMGAAPPLSDWPIIPGFSCRACGMPARKNPADNREWSCAKCNGRTHSVAINFQQDSDTPLTEEKLKDRDREITAALEDGRCRDSLLRDALRWLREAHAALRTERGKRPRRVKEDAPDVCSYCGGPHWSPDCEQKGEVAQAMVAIKADTETPMTTEQLAAKWKELVDSQGTIAALRAALASERLITQAWREWLALLAIARELGSGQYGFCSKANKAGDDAKAAYVKAVALTTATNGRW